MAEKKIELVVNQVKEVKYSSKRVEDKDGDAESVTTITIECIVPEAELVNLGRILVHRPVDLFLHMGSNQLELPMKKTAEEGKSKGAEKPQLPLVPASTLPEKPAVGAADGKGDAPKAPEQPAPQSRGQLPVSAEQMSAGTQGTPSSAGSTGQGSAPTEAKRRGRPRKTA